MRNFHFNLWSPFILLIAVAVTLSLNVHDSQSQEPPRLPRYVPFQGEMIVDSFSIDRSKLAVEHTPKILNKIDNANQGFKGELLRASIGLSFKDREEFFELLRSDK